MTAYFCGALLYFERMEERDVRDIIAGESLNAYELAVFKGLALTRGSKAVKTKAISEAITNVMSGEIELDGQRMSVSEALVVKVVGEALANPSTSKLKDLATIVGDVGATKIELVQSRVDEDLARSAIGEESYGEV